MQTNSNIQRTQKPLRNKNENERERNKDKQQKERNKARQGKRAFAFV